MIRAKGSVNIQTSPEQVFALVSDVRQCGELNPRIEVINITAQPAGQMREGTTFHYRIVVEGRMTEYTSKVLTFEPGRMIEIQTDTDPVVTIRYVIKPTADGSSLEQELTSSLPKRESAPLELTDWFAKLLDKLVKDSDSPEQREAFRQQQEAMMQEQLQAQLNEWLVIVKKYLEEQRDTFLA